MNILVTAGPTREPIDPVRFVSNRSSGRMGYAVAEAARAAGHRVRLISGPVAERVKEQSIRCIPITTAAEMLAAVEANLPWCDVLVMAAAVADWRPKRVAPLKLKKSDGPPRIEWEPTPDILATLAPQKKPGQLFCGFAAETDHVERNARVKLHRKQLDVIAANDVSRDDRGFASTHNALTLYWADGRIQQIPYATKTRCATQLMRALENFVSAKATKKSFKKATKKY